jgi:ubiquinone/menaquinone biosynthesis C-methylase UbiE
MAPIHPVEELEAYYRNRSLDFAEAYSLVPDIEGVLQKGMNAADRVLDIGCGDGHSLINNASLFKEGIGYDDSEYIINLAIASAEKARATNVRFINGKAISLPFTDEYFDFIYSERGPIGHADSTFIEALRVLKDKGRIFYETGGSHNFIEYPKPDGLIHEGTFILSPEYRTVRRC